MNKGDFRVIFPPAFHSFVFPYGTEKRVDYPVYHDFRREKASRPIGLSGVIMRVLQFVKRNTIDWIEVPDPKIDGKNQAILRPLAVSRCDLDLPIIRSQTLLRPPFPLGHEFVAEVVSTSEDLGNTFPKGIRVAVPFQISCGHCNHCSSGQTRSCSSVSHTSAYGMAGGAKEFGGALADFIKVPYAKEMLVPFSDKTDPIAIASINDNLAESWKLVGRFLREDKNKRVLVVGGFASSIGLYTTALAKHMGAAEVTYADTDATRLGMASKYGANLLEVKEYPKSLGKFDIVVECSGTDEGLSAGLRSLDVDATYTIASIFWTNKLPIPFLDLYNNGAHLHIERVKSREWIPEMLRLVEKEGFDPSAVVTKVAKWEDAPLAYLEEETKLVISNL